MKTLNQLFKNINSSISYLNELTDELIELGKRMASSILKKYDIKNVTLDDLEDYILFVINYIYENYNESKKDFEKYVRYVMYKRLTSKILDMSFAYATISASLDEILEDGTPIIELISDEDEDSIPNSISMNEFNFKMSSPKLNDSATDRIKKKVYFLMHVGYSTEEIKKILKLSENQYRYIVKLINADAKNLKMEYELK